MMNNVYIKFMTDDVVQTLRANSKSANENLSKYPTDPSWVSTMYDGPLYVEKKYMIPDFELKTSATDYDEVDFENSIILYESLKDLPRYVLTDERFWAWINFEKGYAAAVQAMPPIGPSVFKDHWLFTQGQRRGIFFGVLSRCFFRVLLTVDETLEDKYELTRFVIEKPERFRNLTWRSNSNEKHIVLGALKAEKKICEEYGDKVKNSVYAEIAKALSLYGSIRLIDAVSEEDIYEYIYNKMKELVEKDING